MQEIDHPRILKLHEEIRKGDKTYLVTTFCNGGNLEDFVIAHQNNGIGE